MTLSRPSSTRSRTRDDRILLRILGAHLSMGQRSSRGKSERGASTVEFAILLPVLLLILFGTIEFGIAFNRTHGLHAAAREGGRVASVGASSKEIMDRVRETQSLFDDRDVVVQTIPSSDPPCTRVGDAVDVVVEVKKSKEYAITIPMFGEFEIDYRATARFRCERNGASV